MIIVYYIGYVQFSSNETLVEVSIAISTLSIDQARVNLNQQIGIF